MVAKWFTVGPSDWILQAAKSSQLLKPLYCDSFWFNLRVLGWYGFPQVGCDLASVFGTVSIQKMDLAVYLKGGDPW